MYHRFIEWLFRIARNMRNDALTAKKTMKTKRRIFLIDPDRVPIMRRDMNDASLMQFYWKNTGIDVETFFVPSDKLRDYFKNTENIEDFALYDDHLLIKYDKQNSVVSYDRPGKKSIEKQLIDYLEEQLKIGQDDPFIRVPIV